MSRIKKEYPTTGTLQIQLFDFVVSKAKKLISTLVANHIFLADVKALLPKQNLLSFCLTNKFSQNLFSSSS